MTEQANKTAVGGPAFIVVVDDICIGFVMLYICLWNFLYYTFKNGIASAVSASLRLPPSRE